MTILQKDTFQKHQHYCREYGGGEDQGRWDNEGWGYNWVNTRYGGYIDDGAGKPRVGMETRGINATMKVWKRIN